MKHFLLSLIFIFSFSTVQSQYSRIKLYADQEELQELQALGVSFDHGEYRKGVYLIAEFSAYEIELINSAGVQYDILIEDVESYYASDRSNLKSLSTYACGYDPEFVPEDPVNFALGSMAGYLTYQEYLDNLDSMAELYPDLISVKQPIDTFLTFEGRPIYWVQISDNPDLVEVDEAEVLYTSLHHAREPISLSQNIYFMWYLLENYSTDSNIQGLLNTTALYFAPMVNPDGYIYNESGNPNGGGMWRKNRRDIEGSNQYGVDLNRNYGYEWGGIGSSGSPSSNTYRGDSAFSEPETQAIKYLCENHEFNYVLNYHAWGNLLLYPYGYDFNQSTPDSTLYEAVADEMTVYNNYLHSSDLYPAAGNSDDWMYTSTVDKPKIMAMTPEVGNEFWPPNSSILGLCQENIYPSLLAARFTGVYADLRYEGPDDLFGDVELPFVATRLGSEDGSISIDFSSGTSGMEVVSSATFNFTNPDILDTSNIVLNVSLDADVLSIGDVLLLNVMLDNGSYIEERSFSFTYQDQDPIGNTLLMYEDDCESLDGFTENEDWALTDEDFYSADYSITDSPDSDYEANAYSWIQLDGSIDLTNAIEASMTFWTKWGIEISYDYAQVLASTGNGEWVPLCGNYTYSGSFYQDFEQPIYHGYQYEWVLETVDLSNFIGAEEVLIAFKFESDNSVNDDGFYFDDISIYMVEDPTDAVESIDESPFSIYPNPNTGLINIDLGSLTDVSIKVLNLSGQLIYYKENINTPIYQFELDASPGIYILELSAEGEKQQFKLVKQ